MCLWPFLVSLHTQSLPTTTTTHSFPRGWTLAASLTLDGFLLDRDTCIVPTYRRMDYIQVAYLKSQTIYILGRISGCTSQLPRYTAFFQSCTQTSGLFLVAPLLSKAHLFLAIQPQGPASEKAPCQSPLWGQCPCSQRSSFPSAMLNGFPTWFSGKWLNN